MRCSDSSFAKARGAATVHALQKPPEELRFMLRQRSRVAAVAGFLGQNPGGPGRGSHRYHADIIEIKIS